MSVSLAVMLSEDKPGGSLNTNVQRLLGVSVGKSLTLIIMAFVGLFGDSGLVSGGIHIAMVFLFMTFFSYVYYDGGYWSYVACLVAGFGCYTLAGTSADQAFSSITLTTRYAEICQLTTAIVGRLIIDALDEGLCALDCRNTILRYTQQLTWKFQQDGHGDAISTKGINNFALQKLAGKPRKWGDKGTPGILIKAMDLLWEGGEKYEEFRKCVDEVAKQIKLVEGAMTNARGAGMLAQGRHASLHVDLLAECLTHMNSIVHELRTLQAIHTSILIDEPDETEGKNENRWDDLIKSLGCDFTKEIEDSMELAFQLLQMALVKEGSEPIQCKIHMTRFEKPLENNKKDKTLEGSTCRQAVARESIEEILEFSRKVQNCVWSSGILRYDRLSP